MFGLFNAPGNWTKSNAEENIKNGILSKADTGRCTHYTHVNMTIQMTSS